MAHLWRCTLLLLGVLIGLGAEASSWHMDHFIETLKELEDRNPDLKPEHLLGALRSASGLNDPFIQHYFGKPSASPLQSPMSKVLTSALHYTITPSNQEVGVVLTRDGSTVALRPLLLGIEAGFLHTFSQSIPVNEAPLHAEFLGPDGCWDNLANPQAFTLQKRPNLLTTAQVNGGMDGVILAREAVRSRSLKLSALFTAYYGHKLDQGSLDAAPRIISQRRRDNFRELMESSESSLGVLSMEAVAVQEMNRRINGQMTISLEEKKQMMTAINSRVKELMQTYADCPPIVTRCMWDAAPFIGSPTYLYLPVSYFFIHHTYSPSTPCLSFDECAADMRSMQYYHQYTNGWSDIGYSFVVGGDGNVYEGRGWFWQGAHTPGYNSLGYGVAYIGDFTYNLPSSASIALVRDKLTSCAIREGHLESWYTLHGHRQVVSTECPGNALYAEIQNWPHFEYM